MVTEKKCYVPVPMQESRYVYISYHILYCTVFYYIIYLNKSMHIYLSIYICLCILVCLATQRPSATQRKVANWRRRVRGGTIYSFRV